MSRAYLRDSTIYLYESRILSLLVLKEVSSANFWFPMLSSGLIRLC